MLTKCCCCVDLELGCKIIGYVIMLFAVICISEELYFLVVHDKHYTPLRVSNIMLEVIEFTLGVILLNGVFKKSPAYLVMFVYCMTILNFTLLMMLCLMMIFEQENDILLIARFLGCSFRAYFILVVESLYRKNLLARVRTLVDLLFDELTPSNKKNSTVDYLFTDM